MDVQHPLEGLYSEEWDETLKKVEEAVDEIIQTSQIPTMVQGTLVRRCFLENIPMDWRREECEVAYEKIRLMDEALDNYNRTGDMKHRVEYKTRGTELGYTWHD